MHIDRKNVLGVDDIYVSGLYKDYYAADFYVLCNGRVLKMRYPYKTKEGAQQMVNYLQGRGDVQPLPDYRRDVWFLEINSGRVK